MSTALTRTLATAMTALCAAATLTAFPAHAHDSDSSKPLRAGIELKEKEVMQEIGLPTYPGAVPMKNTDESKKNVSIGLWGGPFGIKVQVAQFTSTDGVDKVADFYAKSLAQYGQVLDCSEGAARTVADKGKNKDDNVLSCDDNAPGKGQKIYKVGPSSKNFRLVSVKPRKDATQFEVIRILIGRQD